MKQFSRQIILATRGRGFYEFTEEVAKLLHPTGIQTGLATLFIQHTSASLLIQEDADPDVRRDLETFFARLAPDGDPAWLHDVEGPDDMPAHIRAALTATHLTVPIVQGELALGTWQGIYLWEHRTSSHQRHVMTHFLGE